MKKKRSEAHRPRASAATEQRSDRRPLVLATEGAPWPPKITSMLTTITTLTILLLAATMARTTIQKKTLGLAEAATAAPPAPQASQFALTTTINHRKHTLIYQQLKGTKDPHLRPLMKRGSMSTRPLKPQTIMHHYGNTTADSLSAVTPYYHWNSPTSTMSADHPMSPTTNNPWRTEINTWLQVTVRLLATWPILCLLQLALRPKLLYGNRKYYHS
jgi:hypothetical protein